MSKFWNLHTNQIRLCTLCGVLGNTGFYRCVRESHRHKFQSARFHIAYRDNQFSTKLVKHLPMPRNILVVESRLVVTLPFFVLELCGTQLLSSRTWIWAPFEAFTKWDKSALSALVMVQKFENILKPLLPWIWNKSSFECSFWLGGDLVIIENVTAQMCPPFPGHCLKLSPGGKC